MKVFGLSMLAIVLLVGLGWAITENDYRLAKHYMPAMEQVRRETFEKSKAYRDGTVQDLRAMQFEYLRADDAHRAAMASVIRHKLAGFPEDAIPSDLQQFIRELP